MWCRDEPSGFVRCVVYRRKVLDLYCFLRIDSNKVRRIRRRTRSKCVAAVSEHKVKVEVRESVVSRWQKGRSRGEKNENISTKTGATPKTKDLLPPTKSWCGHSAWSNLSHPSPGGDSSAQCSSIISGVQKSAATQKCSENLPSQVALVAQVRVRASAPRGELNQTKQTKQRKKVQFVVLIDVTGISDDQKRHEVY